MKRMLKIILLCAVVCCPLLVKGAPFAEDKDTNKQNCGTEANECVVVPDANLMYSLLPFVVRGKAIRIAVDISRFG